MTDTNIWVETNPNPYNRRVGDCAVRAVCVALDMDWETAYAMMAMEGYSRGDLPSSDAIWGNVLRRHGFKRYVIDNECPDCYSANDFAEDHPEGIYVLGFGGHVATVKDGRLYDAWDSSNEIPQFYWTNETEE